MRLCLHCTYAFCSNGWRCPSCGFEPICLNGVVVHASEFINESEGFKAEYFSKLSELEASNFWFRSRNELIVWALRKYHPDALSLLEVGCGTGFVLSGIEKSFPQLDLNGSEIFIEGLSYATKRLPNVNFMQMDARKIPFQSAFDIIGAFDVLEHIREDDDVLEQVYKALKPEGILLLSVPQHPWLWSMSDDYACHVRRYTANELINKIRSKGFIIERSTSFVSLLLPAMFLSRFKKKKTIEEYDPTAELRLPKILNRLFYFLMRIEQKIIKSGVDLPFGGSRLVVARKKL
jgi:SAM-dependent methyltransferase